MTLFRDRGVVLRTIRLGEADRIVTLMTEQHGKVRAVAKGVRRTTSKFGSRLEPLSHVALLGWQGRGDLDTINQVEVIDTFRPVREDLDRMSRGHVHARGGRPDRPGAARQPPPLRDAGRGHRPRWPSATRPMVAPAFFLKVLALEGSAPVLDVCVSCGEEDADAAGGLRLVGGRACCAGSAGGDGPLSPGGLALLRRTLGGGLAGVLAEPRSPVTDEVTALATEAMEAHLDRRLRSVRSGQVS